MTFSIVARSDDGESWGVAVASKFLAVGSAVPAAVAGVGAIATQADANVAYKGLALSHLDEGATAPVALHRLLEEDEGRDHRQVGHRRRRRRRRDPHRLGVPRLGGRRRPGAGYAIQGNILTGAEVVEAMEAAWRRERPRRTARPTAARGAARRRRGRWRLRAAASRPRCSSSGTSAGYDGGDDIDVDLRVDDHISPIDELERLLSLHEHLNADVHRGRAGRRTPRSCSPSSTAGPTTSGTGRSPCGWASTTTRTSVATGGPRRGWSRSCARPRPTGEPTPEVLPDRPVGA